jgi:hypothetical protein
MGDVVEEHLLVLFTQVIRNTLAKHFKLLNLYKEHECIVIILDSCIEHIKTKQKELLIETLELTYTIINVIKQETKGLVERVLPSSLSTLFNLILNQCA